MDLLLESLKNIYEDMDEEQKLLQEIEDMLMQPDEAPDEKQPDDKLELKPIEQPQTPPQDTTPATDPKQLVKPNVKPPAPKQAPVAAPKSPPKLTPTPVTPAEEPAALPSLSNSTVKTPPRDLEPAEPEAPPVTVDPTGGDPDLQKNIYARLQRLRKAGKQFKSKLNSTALSYMIYNPRTRGLNVTFTKNGRTYHYKNVSMQKAAALFSSNSKGKLFNRDIKPNSKYVEV
jgi:hypothetical protein